MISSDAPIPQPAVLSSVTLTPAERRRFDRHLEQVLEKLPASVHALLEEVPLHVEDHPSPRVMRQLGVEYRDDLCGMFTGRALTARSADAPFELPGFVTIYREGVLAIAADQHGQVLAKNLKEEIRKTILHELAHYHGIDEDELADLGYE